MKITSQLFCLVLVIVGLFGSVARAELQTVPHVEVGRYLGDWYQISHIPLWFEGSDDCACARQRLAATDKAGVVSVVNTCTKADGSPYVISGFAQSEDRDSNAKFIVKFQGVPMDGSYWIIGLDAAYRYAVVTDKWGYSLYILSKTPHLAPALYEEAVAIAKKQLDVSKLKITRQENCSYPK